MDWVKLIGLAVIVFMTNEIISAKLAKLKTWILRIILLVVTAGASVFFAVATPVIVATKAAVILNAIIYFVTEYFIFLFVRNELKLSIKKMILDRFGGITPEDKK